MADCVTITNPQPGYRSRLGFGKPLASSCEPFDRKPANLGYSHQLRIQWTGQARIVRVMAKAQAVPEDQYPICE